MHACHHFQIAKVHKTVFWRLMKGPIGLKSTKNGQKSTKTAERRPEKQASFEEVYEIE
jgi:hypothetical protein